LPVELRWEGLRDKGPRTSVGAPSRGRARACVEGRAPTNFYT
jgi:hypothetical protein